jgi:hypothetical protein
VIANLHRRAIFHCSVHPAAAAAASAVVVTLLSLLVGVTFLPGEFRRRAHHVSVTHCLMAGASPRAVVLFWSIAHTGFRGRAHHLGVRPRRSTSEAMEFPWPRMQPQVITGAADAGHALVGCADGAIYSVSLSDLDDPPKKIAQQPLSGMLALACASDGRTIVSQAGFDLFAYDAQTGQLRWRSDDVTQFGFALNPGPDGTVIVGRQNGVLEELDLRTGHPLRKLVRFEAPLISAAVSSDGAALAALDRGGALTVMDLPTNAVRWTTFIHPPKNCAPARYTAFSPCGRWLVTGGEDNSALVLWDAGTGLRLRELRGHDAIVHGALFLNSENLQSWAADGTIRVWNVATGAMRQVSRFAPPRDVG